METKIIKRRLDGQWTVMDSSFPKRDFTVHYCPLSKKTEYKWVGVGGGCFQEYSRVPRTRSTHEEFIIYPTPTPTPHSVPVPL
jgi:threonine dehydrogenase-like Zn-dependent dehydrogenase